MELKDYIERLSAVSAMLKEMEQETDCKFSFYNADSYWALRVQDTNCYEAYSIDFDTLDEAVKHLDAIRVGINLMGGKEI